MATPSPREPPTERAPKPTFLRWLPWEKLLIWAFFLFVVYHLRHFFFIIFLTFILSYTMRGVVLQVAGLFGAGRERVWLQRILTVVCFALMIFGLYQIGNYFGPRLFEQGRQLVVRIDPQADFDTLPTKILGPVLFKRHFEGRESEAYQTEFQKTLDDSSPHHVELEEFQEAADRLEGEFQLKNANRLWAAYERERGPNGIQRDFELWLRTDVVPELLLEDTAGVYRQAWEVNYRRVVADGAPEISQLPEHVLSGLIAESVIGTIRKDGLKQRNFEDRWEKGRRVSMLEEFSADKVAYWEAFESIYAARANDLGLNYEYNDFKRLRAAQQSSDAKVFSALLDEIEPAPMTEEDLLEKLHARFEADQQRVLTQQFLEQPLVAQIYGQLKTYIGETGNALLLWVRDALRYLVAVPVQIALSLLLSLFITFDIPRIKKGIQSLEQSRARDFYQEIAPGLRNFGRLIGRAFQAQGVIAIFNTLLTFGAIKYLGIQNEVFLCAIVFVCSFIPVLGVVLSSVPIAIMALVQPDGNIWLSLKIIVAILVIHFIETSVLNPKILGEMLHLHPVMVLAVLAIGEHFFGVWGLLMAVPVTVYIIRCVILDAGIPGLIEPRRPVVVAGATAVTLPRDGPESSAGALTSPSADGGVEAPPELEMEEDAAEPAKEEEVTAKGPETRNLG